MSGQDRLIRTSRLFVRLTWFGNRVLLGALVLGLLLTWVFSQGFSEWVRVSDLGGSVHSAMTVIRCFIAIGIIGSAMTDRIFVALIQMIATVSAGNPFVQANARRLQTIGWALVALQLLDILAGLLGKFYPSMSSVAPNGAISLVGWISVLMAFVLSRVFAAGSAMRDELEATV